MGNMTNNRNEMWRRAVESITLLSAEKKIRTLGIVGPTGNVGVGALATAVAEGSASAGRKTLLIDLSGPVADRRDAVAWVPGQSSPLQGIVRDTRGFDVLHAVPTLDSRARFNSAELLRQCLDVELESYSSIIVDLPPTIDLPEHAINPLAAASVCDGVLVVAMTGQTLATHLKQTRARLAAAGAKIVGVVMNDAVFPGVAAEMSEQVRSISTRFPRIGRWIERRLHGRSQMAA
jgi:Mrp family chromosome partitioning ATPase